MTKHLLLLAGFATALCAGACDGAAAEGEGEGSGEGEGESAGEGEGEGESPVLVQWEHDGSSIGAGPLAIGPHDPAAGALDVNLAVRNIGAAPFSILSSPHMLVAGPDATLFSILTQPTNSDVAPGETADFVLRYAPTSAGPHLGRVLFAYGVPSDQRFILDVNATTTGVAAQPGLNSSIYDGSFTALPDFTALTPAETAVVGTISIAAREPDPLIDTRDGFAFVFDGLIDVASAGSHTFFTTSDDGSQLLINGAVVVQNDGLHGPVEQSGALELPVGRHALRVEYFEATGGAQLVVEWQGPGFGRQQIPAAALFH